MTTPPVLRAHRRRAGRWLVAGAALVAVLVAMDVKGARDDRVWAETAIRAEGSVDPGYRGGADVPVSYRNEEIDEVVHTTTYLWDAGLEPEAGARVALEVDPDDPDVVSIAGDRFPVWGNVASYAPWIGVPLAFWLARCWSVRRSRRLARSDGPAFAMLGAVAPRRWYRRRAVLHLYPLDATAGRASLAAVRLVSTAGCPLAGPAFPVEVRGVPRPLGRFVARVPGGVLWPTGRALAAARWPRPGPVVDQVPPPPATPEAVAAWTAGPQPVRLAPTDRAWLIAWAVGLGLAVALGLTVTLFTVVGVRREERDRERRVRTVAEVVGRDGVDLTVTVRYDLGAGAEEATVGVVDPGDYDEGRRYPFTVEPGDPGNARFPGEPYDTATPIAFGWFPAVVAAGGLGLRVRGRSRSARVARTGPYQLLDGWPGTGGDLLVGAVAEGYVRAAVVDQGSRRWWAPAPPWPVAGPWARPVARTPEPRPPAASAPPAGVVAAPLVPAPTEAPAAGPRPPGAPSSAPAAPGPPPGPWAVPPGAAAGAAADPGVPARPPAGPWTATAPWWPTSPPPASLFVAGVPEPGRPVAVVVDGTAILFASRARVPRALPPPPVPPPAP